MDCRIDRLPNLEDTLMSTDFGRSLERSFEETGRDPRVLLFQYVQDWICPSWVSVHAVSSIRKEADQQDLPYFVDPNTILWPAQRNNFSTDQGPFQMVTQGKWETESFERGRDE